MYWEKYVFQIWKKGRRRRRRQRSVSLQEPAVTLCRTRLVHAKVEKKKKKSTKSVPNFRLFLDVMLFSLLLFQSKIFQWRILFSSNKIFVAVFFFSESWINAVFLQWDFTSPRHQKPPPPFFYFLNSSLLFLRKTDVGNCLVLVLEPEAELVVFILGRKWKRSVDFYFVLSWFWLLFIFFGNFWQMSCRSVGIKAVWLRASRP